MMRSTSDSCGLPSPRKDFRGTLRAAALSISVIATSFATVQSDIVHADIGAVHDGLVSEFASFNTPGVVDGRVEAITVDGDRVYVGGTFTQIREPLDGEIIDQPYLFAYSKSSGNIIREFDPELNLEVRALESAGDGSGIFAGGVFSRINGQAVGRGLVKLNDNGDRVAGFGARTNATVKALVRHGNTLYVGGNFDTVSGQSRDRLAAVDITTGSLRAGLDLEFDGVVTVNDNGVRGVDDIDISSDGRVMVVAGNFTSIDNISRPRLALIELEGQARVSSWNTDIYDDRCPSSRVRQYIRGVDISPDDSYVVIGTQGFRTAGNPACDTIVRMEIDDLTNTDVEPTWVNYTGGDSVFEVVSTEHAIYAGGHFRWLTNDTTDDGRSAGPGSLPRAGLGALDPINGLTLVDWQSDRNPRGVGVFSLISEPEGLYIGDDTDFLNGTEHQKLKFLPLTSNTIARPEAPSAPTMLLTPDDDDLDGTSFNGSSFGSPVRIDSSGWSDSRGGVFVGGTLFRADTDSRIWASELIDGDFQPRTQVDLFGLTDNEWDIDSIGGMFFDYEWSRLYYTQRGDSRLFYRAFTPAGPYFGNDEFVADVQGDIPWSVVRGMDVIDGYLYYVRTDNRLYRAEINGTDVVSGTIEAIGGPDIDGRNWDNDSDLLAFVSEGMSIGETNGAEFEFTSSGSDGFRRFQRFEFPVQAGEPVVVRLGWDSTANLELRVLDANGLLVASDTTPAGSPKWLTVPAGNGGTYTASVLIRQGSAAYTLQVNPDEAPPPPPEPRADFEFSTSGSTTSGTWQVFTFDVNAGELVEAEIIWDDPDAQLNVFLRDETSGSRVLVDRDTDNSGSPGVVSAFATVGGQWSIGVRVMSGSVDYDVLVNTTAGLTPPPAGADFEFNSSGTDTSGAWQVFNFDVNAGDLVEAEVIWDNPNATVSVFLRDENRSQVDRDTDGNGSPGTLSAIADGSGRWSVGVRINNGSVNYEVLVNTSN